MTIGAAVGSIIASTIAHHIAKVSDAPARLIPPAAPMIGWHSARQMLDDCWPARTSPR